MMSKDSVKKRLEGDSGLSFTEFTYQLIQGYDYYWLNKNKNAKLQCGGSDQWGNIVTGTELVRRKGGNEAFAFTSPLVTRADGGKFGKSEKGNIWLDPEKTSPYQFYQFWLNATDIDAEKWLPVFTFLSKANIEHIILEHRADPSTRILQKTLAREVTLFIHGQEGLEKAVATTEKLFSGQSAAASSLSKEDLVGMEGIVHLEFAVEKLKAGIDITSFLAEAGIFPSKGEARKMVQNGGVSINRSKIDDLGFKVGDSLLLHDEYLLVQKGKKNYYLVKVA